MYEIKLEAVRQRLHVASLCLGLLPASISCVPVNHDSLCKVVCTVTRQYKLVLYNSTQTSFIEISIEAGILQSGKGTIHALVGLRNALVFFAQSWYGILVSSLCMQL
jgi:hypothetical protein